MLGGEIVSLLLPSFGRADRWVERERSNFSGHRVHYRRFELSYSYRHGAEWAPDLSNFCDARESVAVVAIQSRIGRIYTAAAAGRPCLVLAASRLYTYPPDATAQIQRFLWIEVKKIVAAGRKAIIRI